MEENEKNITLGNKQPQPQPTQQVPEEFMDREFQVPTDDVYLPSEGRFYASGKNTVKIKYLTAEDENILTSPELIRNGKVLDVLLENSIVDKDMKPSQMLTGDRNAVLLKLRATGYGDEYEVKITCSDCGETFPTTALLSKLNIKKLEINPDGNNEFDVVLPKMKIPIKFRLLTGADENLLTKTADLNKKKINKTTAVSTLLTEKFLLQIMEAKGNRDKTYIKKMISAMPISDSLFLREYIREIEPGVDMNQSFQCTYCGKVDEYEVPITAKLFWPNAQI
jgi:hypothetical protein